MPTPYTFPVLHDYGKVAFRRKCAAIRPVIEKLTLQTPGYERRGAWICRKPRAASPPLWQPKLYVCVDAADYWATVKRLLVALSDYRGGWKFYSTEGGYERPDKIVVYAASVGQLRESIARTRSEVSSCGFHALAHAAPSSAYGLEAHHSEGLYVGSDPRGIGTSWRLYRTVCMAWLGVNRRYVRAVYGGEERWMQMMNLATSHEGPRRLELGVKASEEIKRLWSVVNESGGEP